VAEKGVSHYEGYVSEAANVDVLLSAAGCVWQRPKGYEPPGAVTRKSIWPSR